MIADVPPVMGHDLSGKLKPLPPGNPIQVMKQKLADIEALCRIDPDMVNAQRVLDILHPPTVADLLKKEIEKNQSLEARLEALQARLDEAEGKHVKPNMAVMDFSSAASSIKPSVKESSPAPDLEAKAERIETTVAPISPSESTRKSKKKKRH